MARSGDSSWIGRIGVPMEQYKKKANSYDASVSYSVVPLFATCI